MRSFIMLIAIQLALPALSAASPSPNETKSVCESQDVHCHLLNFEQNIPAILPEAKSEISPYHNQLVELYNDGRATSEDKKEIWALLTKLGYGDRGFTDPELE